MWIVHENTAITSPVEFTNCNYAIIAPPHHHHKKKKKFLFYTCQAQPFLPQGEIAMRKRHYVVWNILPFIQLSILWMSW